MNSRLRHLLIVLASALSAIIGVTASQVSSDLRADGWVCPAGTNWDNMINGCR